MDWFDSSKALRDNNNNTTIGGVAIGDACGNDDDDDDGEEAGGAFSIEDVPDSRASPTPNTNGSYSAVRTSEEKLEGADRLLAFTLQSFRDRSNRYVFLHYFKMFFVYGLLDNVLTTMLLGLSRNKTQEGVIIPLVCDPVNICVSLALAEWTDKREAAASRINPPDSNIVTRLTVCGGVSGVFCGILTGMCVRLVAIVLFN
jgi:hypothetical protein